MAEYEKQAGTSTSPAWSSQDDAVETREVFGNDEKHEVCIDGGSCWRLER